MNKPLVEVRISGNSVQLGGARLGVHSTWNRSLVGAHHWRVVLVEVAMTLVMDGNDEGDWTTNTVKLLVALTNGKPLSVTTVVNLNSLSAFVGSGVQVMMPLLSIAADVNGELVKS